MVDRKINVLAFMFFPFVLFAQQPRLVLPIGHTELIQSATLSPDGQKLVTASNDKTAKIWNAYTGKLLLDLKGHSGLVYAAAFFPDGKRVLTSSNDNTAKIWDALTGKILLNFQEVAFGANTASFSPDGRKIITLSAEGIARVSAIPSGDPLFVINEKAGKIRSVVFSPEGKRVLTFSEYSAPKIWDASSGKLLLEMKGNFNYDPRAMQGGSFANRTAIFSPDGKRILAFTQSGYHKIWDAQTGDLLLDYSTNTASSVFFSPDGSKAITYATGHKLKVWDTSAGNEFFELDGFYASFSSDGKKIITTSNEGIFVWDALTGKQHFGLGESSKNSGPGLFSTDGKRIITTSNEGVATWNASTGRLLLELKGYTSSIGSAAFLTNGKKIVTAMGNGMVRIWDSHTGKIVHALYGHTGQVKALTVSPNEKTIVTASADTTAIIWDTETGKLLYTLRGHSTELETVAFSPDGSKVVTTAAWDPAAVLWDVNTGKALRVLEGHTQSVGFAAFSPDGKKIITTSTDKTAKVWDAHTGKLLLNLRRHTDYCIAAAFSPDGNKIITVSWDRTAVLWDAVTGNFLFDLAEGSKYVNSVIFSPDGKRVVTYSYDGTAKIWDVQTGNLFYSLAGHSDGIATGMFSSDGQRLLTASFDNTVKSWSVQTGKPLFTLKEHSNAVHVVAFSPDNKQILTASKDNTCKIWDAERGDLKYTFFATSNYDNFIQIPTGFYQTTPTAAKLLHYVTKDLKVITFDQLDVKYNRPDKVLEAIGNTDTALIKSYRKAWEKRIKKLGIDTTAFRDGYSVPESDFVNRDAIEYEQKTGTLELIIKGNDSTYKLDRFNVWVNETPIFGQRGISIRKRNKNDFDTTITIKLSQGENRIEASITNVNGTESYRMPLAVNYSPAVKQKESVRFIGIGIDQFLDSKNNLQYSAKDIRDLSKKLKEKYKDDIIIDTLFNENVNIGNVKTLKEKLKNTTVNDKVIVAYSGHGLLSKEYDYYLSTYNINFDKPEQNGLPYDELENLLDSIPARKKLMLIDACHSGEVDKEDLVTLASISDSLIKGFKPVAYKGENHLGLRNSFELMQSLFVNVGKSTGATIISAAAGTQFALERNDLKNGVFTYSILEAMSSHPSMKISELKNIVGKRVEELTKGLQKPTSRNETIATDWNLW